MIEIVGVRNYYVPEETFQLANVGGWHWWEIFLAPRAHYVSDSGGLARGLGSQESGHFEELMMIGSHGSKSLVWKRVVENDRSRLVKPALGLRLQKQGWEYCSACC